MINYLLLTHFLINARKSTIYISYVIHMKHIHILYIIHIIQSIMHRSIRLHIHFHAIRGKRKDTTFPFEKKLKVTLNSQKKKQYIHASKNYYISIMFRTRNNFLDFS